MNSRSRSLSAAFAAMSVGLLSLSGVGQAGRVKPWVASEPGSGPLSKSERIAKNRALIATCLVSQIKPSVVQFLATATSDSAYPKVEAVISRNAIKCSYSRVGYGANPGFDSREVIFVGMLAEAMLNTAPRPMLTVIDESATDFRHPWMEVSARGIVQQMAVCVVAKKPTESVALIAARSDSSKETQMFGKLQATIGECLVNGVTLSLTGSEMRAYIAEAVYHRTADAASPAVTNLTEGGPNA